MNLEGHCPGAHERAGEQSPHGEEAELGNVPTASTASCTSAFSLSLLDLKQTPAAAAPQVIPKDAPPARAIVLLLWGCLSVLRSTRQVRAATPHTGGGGPDTGEGSEVGGGSEGGGGPHAGLEPDTGLGSDAYYSVRGSTLIETAHPGQAP